MNPSDSAMPALEDILSTSSTTPPGVDAMEAMLIDQANTLSRIFVYLTQAGLQAAPGTPAAERLLRLALRTQAQSGRILADLCGLRKPSRKPLKASSEPREPLRNVPVSDPTPIRPIPRPVPPASASPAVIAKPAAPEKEVPAATGSPVPSIAMASAPSPVEAPLPPHAQFRTRGAA